MNWHTYYMQFAEHAATKAKHTTKVGAVLIGIDGEIRLTGYNGPPRYVDDTLERISGPQRYLYHSHAEQNIVAFAAREGIKTKNCTLYVTHLPCASCARSIIQAGITEVIYGDGTTSMSAEEFVASQQMFREAGVEILHINHAINGELE